MSEVSVHMDDSSDIIPPRVNIQIANLKTSHKMSELYWIHQRVYKFLQTDRPKEAIFDYNMQFGIELKREPNFVQVRMVYDKSDL